MLLFHIVFWLLSVIFGIQLYQIRQQQKDLYKREFFLNKRMSSENVENDYSQKKINQRLAALEKDVEIILNHIRHAPND